MILNEIEILGTLEEIIENDIILQLLDLFIISNIK